MEVTATRAPPVDQSNICPQTQLVSDPFVGSGPDVEKCRR